MCERKQWTIPRPCDLTMNTFPWYRNDTSTWLKSNHWSLKLGLSRKINNCLIPRTIFEKSYLHPGLRVYSEPNKHFCRQIVFQFQNSCEMRSWKKLITSQSTLIQFCVIRVRECSTNSCKIPIGFQFLNRKIEKRMRHPNELIIILRSILVFMITLSFPLNLWIN